MFKVTTVIKKILALKRFVKGVQGGTSAGKTFGIIPILIDICARSEMVECSIVAESIPHLKRGAMKDFKKIMLASFTMEEWQADESATVEADCSRWSTAYFWIVPAKVEGTWKMPQGTLTIRQQFQHFSGTLGSDPVTEGHLRGDTIEFAVGPRHYTGRVNGSRMQGTVAGGTNGSWNASRQ